MWRCFIEIKRKLMPQRFSIALPPLIIVLAGLYISLYVERIPLVWQAILEWLPVILAGLVVLLAWHFNKGRVLLITLLFVLPLVGVETLGSPTYLSSFFVVTAFCAALLSQMAERGFFNRFAVNRIAVLSMLLLWCYGLSQGWVQISSMKGHLILTQSPTIPLIAMFFLLTISILLLLFKWWKESDFFSACVLASLLLLAVLNSVTLNGKQQDILLAALFLLWCIYLLIDSHNMAYIDDLTQLPGRRALNERLVSLSKRYSIAMLDVDHFKNFNDTYGHDMGDVVLKRVARNVGKVTNGGKGFRYGGEEFAIVFSNRTVAEIEEALESVRKSIEAESIPLLASVKKTKKTTVSVTISIGAAFSATGRAAENVIKVADDHLYKAKKAGRNRVILETKNRPK